MTPRFLVLAAAALLGSCAQSPLYDTQAVAGGTRDEVPRDGNGEPMLGAIRPIPAGSLAIVAPKPVAP
jgi:hypothetical protein